MSRAITQTDAEMLALLKEIIHAVNTWKVNIRDGMLDCCHVIYWHHSKRELVKIRRKYAAMRVSGRKE